MKNGELFYQLAETFRRCAEGLAAAKTEKHFGMSSVAG
jgi:hypothetical protein